MELSLAEDPPRILWWRRLLGSCAGAILGLLLIAALDGSWARAAATPRPGWTATWLAVCGLLAPLALGMGAAVGLASLLLHPLSPPTVPLLLRRLEQGPEPERRERRALLLTSGAAATLWIVGVARLALELLVAELPASVVGVTLAGASLGFAFLLGLLALGGARVLGQHSPWTWPRPLVLLGVTLLMPAGIVLVAVWAGSVGGAGDSSLAVFGVLKRQELDLRAPALLAVLALAAYSMQAILSRAPLGASLAAGALCLAATGYSAVAGLAERQVALAVERGAPLARLMLRPLRSLEDRDRDGSSALFGGGDCAAQDATRYPGASDIPGNGIDEDCSGKDSQVVSLPAARTQAPKSAAEWVDHRLPQRLNVVWVSIDAWRWDTVAYAGAERPITPNVDRLAKKSVVFSQAYALASYTGKSVPPMMIGKYTSETDRGWSHFNTVSRADTLIWERLRQHGVRTLSVQAYWYFFRKGTGFERGWDVLDGSVAPTQGYVEHDTTSSSDRVADRSIELLSQPQNVSGQFFYWTHLVDPHADYVKHEGFDFGDANRDKYDSEVAFCDHHLGRIIDFIQNGPLADRTAIIVSSDHGEAFGEHGMIRHGFEIWEPLVRVPLVIYVPGANPHRVDQRRSLVDLVPTVLDLMRKPHPTNAGTDFISGRSLLFDIFMPEGHRPEERIVFIDMAAGPNNAERQGFIENDLKLIASNGRPLGLYDLKKDPSEAQDLLDDAALRERTVDRYQAFRRSLREVKVKPVPK